MLGRREIWDKLKEYVESPDICLFDIDLPSGSKGTLRVFIARRDQHSAGVALSECASVSKIISAAPEFDEMLHVFQLEVSSPGVNRRLRNLEHFEGAIGERIKVTTDPDRSSGSIVIGKLKSVDTGQLELELDGAGDTFRIEIGQVKKARVDFLF